MENDCNFFNFGLVKILLFGWFVFVKLSKFVIGNCVRLLSVVSEDGIMRFVEVWWVCVK